MREIADERGYAAARAVWADAEGQGRNLFARFRLELALKDKPKLAELHLFADTIYQLFVNGDYIRSGGVRFDPRYPVADSHDLTGLLVPGVNRIAVQVNYVGHKTFMNMPAQAGFKAWGKVVAAGGEEIGLATGVADWQASYAPAYRYAAKSSLFLKAGDAYDQRLEEEDWSMPQAAKGAADRAGGAGGAAPTGSGRVDGNAPTGPGGAGGAAPTGAEAAAADASGSADEAGSEGSGGGGWRDAVILDNQRAWGKPTARMIPYMSGEPLPVRDVLCALPLAGGEKLYSFSVPMPHVKEIHEPSRLSPFMAFRTWIYAPRDMRVTVGLYYQDTWINGVKVEPGIPSSDKSMRLNRRIELRQGWNDYFGKGEALQDMYHHYLALPADAGLIVSADRDPGGAANVLFRRTPVLSPEAYERSVAGKPLPYAPDDELPELGGWVDVPAGEAGASPTMSSGWDNYGEPFETVTAERLNGRLFPLADYPAGFSLLLDMGQTVLALPHIVLEGAGGATIDMTYSEHVNADGKHLRHSHWYGLGDRAIADAGKDKLDWRLTQPRGFRYLQLTVREPQADVKLALLELLSASYPAVKRGSFRCSDPLLNEIWEMGARTQAVNMEDAYTDCVTRERGMYIRDTIIQYHNNLALFGDHALMRRCMELFGQSADGTGKFRAVYPNTGDYTISDFSLNALEGFRAYYHYTGDASLIAEHWDAIRRNLAWFHELADERDDLLLDAEWDVKRGIKAHYGGFHGDLAIVKGYMDITGIHCVFSCTYLIALRCARELASAIGQAEDLPELDRRIAVLERSIRDSFWDEERGCYADSLDKRTFSAHASLFAARAGVMTEAQAERARRHVGKSLASLFVNGYGPEDGVYVSPSFSFYIFDGLYRLGLFATAENMMRQGWGWFLQKGLKQTPEYFNLAQSLCHAWSACPTWFLSRHVLGVELPGGDRPNEVAIRVRTETVAEAEGAVPHPRGLIEVKWHRGEAGEVVFDYVRLPEGLVLKQDGPEAASAR